ncbi:MAG: hypothetical protein M0Z79_12485 [Nitrospiraceae bacterium]|nr:hypothetical protein [Nitrospiraceae bacterium]
MKRLMKRFENMMMAVTFAEAGEHDTARAIMKETEETKKKDRVTPSQRPGKTMRASSRPRP